MQESGGSSLDSLELLAGVVGPSSLAQLAQKSFHASLGQGSPAGWSAELKDEPGLVLSYDRKWRLQAPIGGGYAAEIIPEVGGSVGNVFTYGQAGAILRFGKDLGADYGPARIRPSLSGTTWFDAEQAGRGLGWYVFAGAQARLVAHNIFLDGNTFQTSASVEKKPMVADFSAGLALFWSDRLKLDVVMTERSKEFTTQNGRDHFGGVNLSVRLP